MLRMTANITIVIAFSLLLMLVPSSLATQNNSRTDPKIQTLTGCIFRGDAVSPYKLSAKDGIWHLVSSDKRMLARQINHIVTATGKVTELFDAKAPRKDGMESNYRGTFNVRAIKMVSTTCPK